MKSFLTPLFTIGNIANAQYYKVNSRTDGFPLVVSIAFCVMIWLKNSILSSVVL